MEGAAPGGAPGRRVDEATAARYRAAGWWSDATLAGAVAGHAAARPGRAAIVCEGDRLTWAGYHALSHQLAGILAEAGLAPGERVAVWLPDGAAVHLAYLANEKAGCTTVGIGARAGPRELRHLLERTGAVALVTHERHGDEPAAAIVQRLRADGVGVRRHVVLPRRPGTDGLEGTTVDGAPAPAGPQGAALDAMVAARRLGADDLFCVNSTSGTTGMPKCVLHTQNRHTYINEMAKHLAGVSGEDVFLSVVPAPFGFGLWTAHFTPGFLGATTVLAERFSAGAALRLVEAERATVLCCVSTQFVMMLQAPEAESVDCSSLRVMFTGGEAVPYERAREFEDRTGARVLQFYGSNESGVVTGTSLRDTAERRLRTAGTVLPGTELRLYRDGADVTAGRRGQPGARGPSACLGYLDDPEANAQLFTPDGFILHADECTLDRDGALAVVGRTSDIIIRGGKNISAAVVEAAVLEHPAVALAAAVAVPDPVFGERVGVFVELRGEGATLDLEDLVSFLLAQGASKETLPEHLFVRDALPRSSGAKVAKGQLRREAAELAGRGR